MEAIMGRNVLLLSGSVAHMVSLYWVAGQSYAETAHLNHLFARVDPVGVIRGRL